MSAFEQLVRELLQATRRVDKSLQQLQERAVQIRQKYEPRTEFERWKQTLGGRKWKRQQFERQKGRCLHCKKQIRLRGSHIDHIRPLSHYPSLVIAPENLRLLCAECNLSRGNRDQLEPY